MPLHSVKFLNEKLREALVAVMPIVGIVLFLCFTIAPVSSSILLCFIMGAALIIIGMMFFTLGAEMAMTPMGERLGAALKKSNHLIIIVLVTFLLGFIITISEPDLQVLASQVPSVPNMTIILSVACGVGVFLVIALLRMLFSIALPSILVTFYIIIFILARFVPNSFWGVAFDSGGVTTGPMTVPFIMALGVGISSIRSDRHAASDSFGLVALCSIGPILAVLILGMIFNPDETAYMPPAIPDIHTSTELFELFAKGLPIYIKEIAVSLFPIVLFFFIFQLIVLKLSKKTLIKITIGLVYTYTGLVLFLTGANVGFMPAGNYLGKELATGSTSWLLIPGYAIALGISFFVPKLYTAIAFDSGGVASGPMTAAFLLPLAQGACIAVGGDIVADAFGVVAMVAMTPLITIQIMGLVSQIKLRQSISDEAAAFAGFSSEFDALPEDAIIEL